ncbi:hypothetical protein LGM39_14235 [Burkholderia cepacia]|uniref:hypothetical protein n=2 Tax=Burkholderia cepacia TaxID=292 RepID=UPI001CF2BB40|nr:hypothetical protein [Burkholderia cepacia]MCA7900535.1 hypothetical protein [Burkholderia cepacia]
MLPSRAKGRGPTPAFATGARPWIPDCRIVRLPEALRMVFGDDAASSFTLRRQRFVHLGHRPPLHHVSESLYSVAAGMHDLVVVSVIDSPSPHVFRAKIEQIYSCGKGITPDRLGTEFEFYSGPATWGNVPLQIEERALLFVHQVSGVFNEYPWRGHMVLEEIDGESYARLQIPELWLRDDLPEAVKAAAAPHPTRRNASIVRFGALENYLKGLIEKAVR